MSDEIKPPYVRFEIRAVEDRTASIEGGHYASKDVIFAIVTPAGSRDCVEKEASDWIANIEEGVRQERIPASWLREYRHALKMFEETNEVPENGTSIKNWPALSPSQVRLLLDLNLRTVEDVAQMTEEAISHVGMGARSLREKAQSWLDSSKDHGKVSEELNALRVQNKELLERDKKREAEFQTMKSQLETLMQAQTAKSGTNK